MKFNSKLFVIFLFGLFMTSNIHALTAVFQPPQSSTTNLGFGACGTQAALRFTIQNNGQGGVLCWYTTSDNSVPQKLTTSCIRPGSTSPSYPAYVTYPTNTQ
ncbi:hypothetical protein HZC07_02620 [Candidatus Micrarchaeota archaeon]|nr:hypothetical protein [Candidatus Micrarchaeota archaeon]